MPLNVLLTTSREICDTSKCRIGCRRSTGLPKIEYNRLACRQPSDALQRHGKFWPTNIFAKREKRAVARKKVDGILCALVDLYLFDTWIAFHIHDTITKNQVVMQLIGTAYVQHRVRITVKLIYLRTQQRANY